MFQAVMFFAVRPALPSDRMAIYRIYRSLNRPRRRIWISEYLVAEGNGQVLGCAAVRMFAKGGYLYGLAVRRDSQRSGIGAALTRARMSKIRNHGGDLAVVLAMFWNVGFFRKLGFATVRREELDSAIRRLADFRNPLYKRSAVLSAKVMG
jgi:N-acetylglutamate synthase-like GNAT family acetyltransferase